MMPLILLRGNLSMITKLTKITNFKLSGLFSLFRTITKRDLAKTVRYLGISMCLLAMAIFIPFVYDHVRNPRIGVVNITGIVDEFVKTEAKNILPPEELKRRVQIFGTSLEKVLRGISIKKRVILMPSEAVIAGAKDYTQEAQKLLYAATAK